MQLSKDEKIEEAKIALRGAIECLRKSMPFLPADKEALFVGEWLDDINEVLNELSDND